MSNKHQPATSSRQQPAPQAIDRFLDLQRQEMDIRAKELETHSKEIEYNSRYAQNALEAHAQDRKDERDHQTRRRKGLYIIIGVVVAMLLVFLFAAAYIGKENLAIEVVKLLVAFLGGGGGGYAIGKSASHKTTNSGAG